MGKTSIASAMSIHRSSVTRGLANVRAKSVGQAKHVLAPVRFTITDRVVKTYANVRTTPSVRPSMAPASALPGIEASSARSFAHPIPTARTAISAARVSTARAAHLRLVAAIAPMVSIFSNFNTRNS